MLGLGGVCSYSTVAVLLDINKQVLYARNQEGTILARQLIAISQSEELVCFYIYPEGTNNNIKKAFYEYDIRFADALSIKVYQYSKDRDDDYNVENIIAPSWWDDCAWDFVNHELDGL